MKTKNYALTAGQPITLGGGNTLVIVSAPDPVQVDYYKAGRLLDETAESVGQGYKGQPERTAGKGLAFDYAMVTSATTQTVKIGVSWGNGDYNVLGGAISTTASKASTLADQADFYITAGAPRLLVAANSSRRVVTVQALSTNGGSIRAGTGSVGASRGIELQPGQSHDFEVTAAIYVYSAVSGYYAIASEVRD